MVVPAAGEPLSTAERRLKGDVMHKWFYVIAAAAFALVPLSARSADLKPLTLKARTPVLLSYTGCGSYFGLGTFAEVDRANITGTAGPAVNADVAGGSLSIVGGYMCGDATGSSWKAIEVSANWQNIGGSNVAGTAIPANMNTQIGFTERVLIGGPLASVLNLLPDLSTLFPVLPAATFSTTTHPYLFAALHEDDVSASYFASSAKVWRVRAGVGTGIKQQLGAVSQTPGASTVTMDIWSEYLFAGQGLTLGNTGGVSGSANQGAGARLGMTLEY